jgi:ketosteroid isomerase-like protein
MRRRRVLRRLWGAGAALAAAGTRGAEGAPQPDEPRLLALLDEFARAWNRHDAVALMACMSDECVFAAASGAGPGGTRHVGRQAVRTAYEAIFALYPDGRWNDARHVVSGDRGVSEWTFTGTTREGTKVVVNGCDLFTFRDGKIDVKDSFRKQLG